MFSDPVKNVKALGLREDSIVADLGAGTGYYSIELAKILERGRVYAVDVQKDFLDRIKNHARDLNIKNLECIWGDLEKKEGTKIKTGLLDAVVISNVFLQISHREIFVEEVRRILKDQGKILLVDWSHTSPLISKNHKIVPKNEVRKFFENNGFVCEREIDAGEHHYGIIFSKK